MRASSASRLPPSALEANDREYSTAVPGLPQDWKRARIEITTGRRKEKNSKFRVSNIREAMTKASRWCLKPGVTAEIAAERKAAAIAAPGRAALVIESDGGRADLHYAK